MVPAISLLMSPENYEGIIDCAKDNEIDHFEIVCDKYCPENLNVVSAQSLFNGIDCDNFFTSSENIEKYSDILISRIRSYYNDFGCKNFVFGSPKFRNVSSPKENMLALTFFRNVCDNIPKDAILALENNPEEYGTNFGTSFKECLAILLMVDRKNFKINFDIGGFIKSGDKDIEAVAKSIHQINHIHVSRFGLQPISELSDNEIKYYKEIVSQLRKADDKKTISLEVNIKNGLSRELINKEIQVFKEIIQ